ncbi:MAG: ribosomal protein S18-alanine N-acetyltransferase [Thermoproteota archaeon]|nr:ribosomal protein S18-alanine N-acetyltransferase [Candidatus Brockarchaeota archaeon]
MCSYEEAPELKIDFFRLIHLKKILEIENESFNNPYDEAIFKAFSSKHPENFLVALFNKDVVGYIMFDKLYNSGIIVSIAVSQRFRRKGIGGLLLTKALGKLKELGAKEVLLQVEVTNNSAISFYKKFGFNVEAILPNYYGIKRDAYLMKLKLP